MSFDVLLTAAEYQVMPHTVRTLLEQAHAWCAQERGRQTQLADYLGVSRHTVNAWFAEYQKEHPKRQPTADQILALLEFLKTQKRKSK
jgi:hypothetical protein